MERDVLLVVVGGGIGFVSSLLTVVVTQLLEWQKVRREWEREDKKLERERLSSGVTEFTRRPTIFRDSGAEYCFPAGVRILRSSREPVTIESLKPGDLLASFNFMSGTRSVCTITSVEQRESQEIIVVNDSLRITPSHEICTVHGWKRADELSLTMRLTSSEGTAVPVQKLTFASGREDVFLLHTNAPFYAEGFLVNSGNSKRRYDDSTDVEESVDILPNGRVVSRT